MQFVRVKIAEGASHSSNESLTAGFHFYSRSTTHYGSPRSRVCAQISDGQLSELRIQWECSLCPTTARKLHLISTQPGLASQNFA